MKKKRDNRKMVKVTTSQNTELQNNEKRLHLTFFFTSKKAVLQHQQGKIAYVQRIVNWILYLALSSTTDWNWYVEITEVSRAIIPVFHLEVEIK